MFSNGFCVLYVKIWNLLIFCPVSFSWWPLFPKQISQAHCLLKVTFTLLEDVFFILPDVLQIPGLHSIKEVSWSFTICFPVWILTCFLVSFTVLQASREVLDFFLKGVLLIPSYSFLVVDSSPLQRLPGWEQTPDMWKNLFSTQLERLMSHLIFCQLDMRTTYLPLWSGYICYEVWLVVQDLH